MTRKELVTLAIRAATRYDTPMAAAFRRALGVAAPPGWGERLKAVASEPSTAREMRECFENRESPLDGWL